MNSSAADASRDLRRAWGLGLGTASAAALAGAGAILGGLVPAGRLPLDEGLRQTGYLFTGLVFLASAWAWTRRGRLRAAASGVAILSAVAMLPAGLGLAYWTLAGPAVARHVGGFLVLPPLVYLALAPWPGRRELVPGAPAADDGDSQAKERP